MLKIRCTDLLGLWVLKLIWFLKSETFFMGTVVVVVVVVTFVTFFSIIRQSTDSTQREFVDAVPISALGTRGLLTARFNLRLNLAK